MEEKDLVRSARGGDFDAFSRLIADQKERIYRLALRITGSREDAEDILQETLLKAIEKIDTFRMESSFGTWLYTIALNNIRVSVGNRKRMAVKPVEEYLPGEHGDHAELSDWDDPHRLFERKELQELIDSFLAEMPAMYSVPFVLRYMEEMSIRDVARALKLTKAATKSRILRARLALREKLSEKFAEQDRERL